MTYAEKYKRDIRSGRKPASLWQYCLNNCYRHRYDWFLLFPIALIGVIYALLPGVLGFLQLQPQHNSYGTVSIALLGLPLIAFAWFLRSYERNRELVREEHALWSGEFARLMQAAADPDPAHAIQRRVAIRQLQEFLTGAKWPQNRRGNSTAIFELISSVIDEHRQEFLKWKDSLDDPDSKEGRDKIRRKVEEIRNDPVIQTIQAVLASSFPQGSPPVVVDDSLSGLHFDFLDIPKMDWRSLDLSRASFMRTSLFEANLSGANLSGAKLNGAGLSWVKLSGAKLNGADLFSSNLSGANLSGANMTGADLRSADLSGAYLNGAHLRGAICAGPT